MSVLECSQIDPYTEAQQSLGVWPGVLLLGVPPASCKKLMMEGSYTKELRSADTFLLNSAGWSSGVHIPCRPPVRLAVGGTQWPVCRLLSLLLIPQVYFCCLGP